MFDVAIAGGGLIGASIAWELAEAGLRVGLFDRRQPGQEASWAGAGILSPAPENSGMIPLVEIGKASMRLYPEYVARVEEVSGLSAGFRPRGTVEALFSADAREELSTTIALHHGLGLRAEPLSADDARALEPALTEDLAAAVLRPDEASVDNRALTAAALEAARRTGAEIFPDAEVVSLASESERCTGMHLRGEKVAAKCVVLAAGCFTAQIQGAEACAPVMPAKGQMVALRAPGMNIERVLWSDKVYLVPRNDGRVLAGATVERIGFDKNVTAGAVEKILRAAVDLAPGLANAQIEESWAGLRPDSPDHLPILGPGPLDGLVVATGHFRSGILLAPITARLVREWITLGRVSVDWERFSPRRFQFPRERAGAKQAMR